MTDQFRDFDEDPDDDEAVEVYTKELKEAVESFGVPIPPNPSLEEISNVDLPRMEVPE